MIADFGNDLFRWAPTHLLAVERLDIKFETLVDHLEEVSLDDDFSPKAREKADELRDTILDENFLALIAIQRDVLSQVATQSLFYQARGLTWINEQERQQTFLTGLKVLKQKKGPHLTKFLEETKCSEDEDFVDYYIDKKGKNVDIPSCKTLQHYETSSYKVR